MRDAVYSQAVGDYTVTTVVSGLYRENGYILTHGKSATTAIVDPGGRAEEFVALLEESGTRLAGIVLTHGHFDHVGAVHDLCTKFSVPCWLDARDQKLAKQASLFGLRFEGCRIRSPVITPFDAPARLEVAPDLVFNIAHTPGHTPGSTSVLIGGAVFVGDLLFRELVGPTVYPGSDRAALLRSINDLLGRAAPEAILFAGHGRPWTVLEARAWWGQHGRNPPAMKLFGEPGGNAKATVS